MDRIQTLKEYLEAEPTDQFLRYALALEFLKNGLDQEAGLLFELLVFDSPDYLPVCYHFGKLLVKQGRTELALAEFKRGMTLAQKVGDKHTYAELSGALEDLTG